DYPHTWAYLKRFEHVLRARGGWEVKQAMKAGKPFYSMSEIGDYTFAPWKVVWPWIAKGLRAVVVDMVQGKPVVPEHNTFLVACYEPDEAFYICALMNSSAGDLTIRSFFSTGGGGIGSPIVLEHVRIPKYNSNDLVHRALAEASQAAHEAAAQGDVARLREIEERIDQLAAQLWGLTERELKIVRSDLAEVGGDKV
ncbi:MAG: SAM-dependent DNA methyltransferase, partial [Methanomassiliicoccales archaeon]|nr:SAM-dependent DNA methyltransferase [Methanomassiliicoccales archaeon]